MPILPLIPAITAKAFVAMPRVVLAPIHKQYALGDPIPIAYRLLGATRIPMLPIVGCSVGTSDFSLELTVRAADGMPLAPPSMHTAGGGGASCRQDWVRPTQSYFVVVNNWVSLANPGTYIVTGRITVHRPGSAIWHLDSSPITVQVVDTPRIRARRRRHIRLAARIVRMKNPSSAKGEAAIQALRYYSDPEALPILLDAFNHTNDKIQAAAMSPLMHWHEPQVVYDAAYRWLETHTRKPEIFFLPYWAAVLQESELRARYPEALFGSAVDLDTAKQSTETVKRLLESGLPFLSKEDAAMRRVLLLGSSFKPISTEQIRPILEAVGSMTAHDQLQIAWLIGPHSTNPSDMVLRPLSAMLLRIARDKKLHPDLRWAARSYLIGPQNQH